MTQTLNAHQLFEHDLNLRFLTLIRRINLKRAYKFKEIWMYQKLKVSPDMYSNNTVYVGQ